jgi:hypothetical protein
MPSSGGSVSDAPVNKVVDGQSHYLAYITPDEGKSLQQQGGKEVITDQGIPAYPGHWGGSTGSSSQSSGGHGQDRHPPSPPSQPSHSPSPHVDRDQLPVHVEPKQDITKTPNVPSDENLLTGDVDIFTGTKEVVPTRGPMGDEMWSPAKDDTYEQKTKDIWENKKVINTSGGEIVVDTQTGEVNKDIADFDKTITQKKILDKTDPNSEYYKGVDRNLAIAAAKNEYDQTVDNFYDQPDKKHFNQTQREINTKIKEAKKDDRYDVSLTTEQSKQFQKDMNEYYGTEGKKYEEYGRGGKGTVNLTFDEHWKNAPILHPALKFSPSARFLYVIGKQAHEAFTSDYGTYKYAGQGTDQGGLLGGFMGGSGEGQAGINISSGASTQSSKAASNYIATGQTQSTGSVAGNWYQSLGGTKAFDLATEYAAAKKAIQNRLNTASTYGWLAVNDSPFYNWLKTNSLNKGII